MQQNQQQAVAANNLFAAIVLNNPQGIAMNLAKMGIPVPPTSITVEAVQQVCILQCPDGIGPVATAQFIGNVLNVPIMPNQPYYLELMQLQAEQGGKSMGQLAYEIMFAGLTADAGSPAGLTAMNTAVLTPVQQQNRKVAAWVVGILALIGLMTILYVMAKAVKKIIS